MRYTDSKLLNDFRLMDCLGIEPSYGKVFFPNDIFFLLQGHVKRNYKFDPNKPITTDSEFYERKPKIDDKVHCAVFVIDAKAMYDGIQPELIVKIRWIKDKIKEADVSRVLILTKADLLCGTVRGNPSYLFRSLKVKEAINAASEVFAIEKASIHPLINYEDVLQLTTDRNIPILLALRQILQYAANRVDFVLDEDN